MGEVVRPTIVSAEQVLQDRADNSQFAKRIDSFDWSVV